MRRNYNITVDASMQTAGNPRFWATGVGTGVGIISLRADWHSHVQIVNRELGMQRVRGHGVPSDDKDAMAIFKWSGSGMPTCNWTSQPQPKEPLQGSRFRDYHRA